eukprot:gene4974-34753_t
MDRELYFYLWMDRDLYFYLWMDKELYFYLWMDRDLYFYLWIDRELYFYLWMDRELYFYLWMDRELYFYLWIDRELYFYLWMDRDLYFYLWMDRELYFYLWMDRELYFYLWMDRELYFYLWMDRELYFYQWVDKEAVLLPGLYRQLDATLRVLRPRKSVMLALDGPGPLPKRQPKEVKGKKKVGQVLSGNAVTPGTTFMLDLTTSLMYYIGNKLASQDYCRVQFELSDGLVPGEGEVKILWRMAHHWHPTANTDSHVIMGDDSDLILMALVSQQRNV